MSIFPRSHTDNGGINCVYLETILSDRALVYQRSVEISEISLKLFGSNLSSFL